MNSDEAFSSPFLHNRIVFLTQEHLAFFVRHGLNSFRAMNKRNKIYILFFFMLLLSFRGLAQSATTQDTLNVKDAAKRTNAEEKSINATGNGSTYMISKQVRNGRPDMTRSAGARPPVIVRPSGGGIPKGVGKPGGAGRKGGR